MKFCPECGNKLSGNVKFCSECGYGISDISSSNAFVNDSSEKNNVVEKLSSEAYIKKTLAQSTQPGISISPFEDTKKLAAAAKTIAKDVDPTIIIGLIDISLMSSGKSGAVFTGTHLYLKEGFNENHVIPFEGMQEVKYELEKELDQNNKVTETKSLKVYYKDGSCINVTSKTLTMNFPFDTITPILQGMLTQVDSFKSKNQVVQLENLRPEVITLYFRVIIAYLRMDDNIIDAKEYKELLSLMTKVKMSKKIADELRKYRFQDNAEDVDMLIQDLRDELEIDNISAPIIFQSLGMELVSMNKEILEKWDESDSLTFIFDKLNVDKKQVEFTVQRIIQSERIYTEKLDNNQIKDMATELTALATGAGISLAALAITGAVTGWGAGVSGGLWALAFGSTVGSGGALLGVATVAAGAYGAYRGVKYFAGTSELEKYSLKQEALTNRITMLRAANIYILDDLNYLMGSINGLTEKIIEHQQLTKEITSKSGDLLQQKNAQIVELANKLQMMSNRAKNISESGKIIEEEQESMELESCLTALPEELDNDKFKQLVEADINKVQFIKIIDEVYREDESGRYLINKELGIEKFRNALAVLENIKYNDTGASSVAQGKVIAKKGLNSLKSLFSEDK